MFACEIRNPGKLYCATGGRGAVFNTIFARFKRNWSCLFLSTTSPFEWQSFLPRQPLLAPSDHNPAWLERQWHEIMISHVCLNGYSRTSQCQTQLLCPPVFGLSGEWGCLIDGHWDWEIRRTDRSAGLPLHWWIFYWQTDTDQVTAISEVCFWGCLASRK